MIVIFEGMDRCGKDTQISMLKSEFTNNVFHTLHYSNVKCLDSLESRKYSFKLYSGMFRIVMDSLYKDNDLILNRAHLGEHVYGSLYRDYDGSYVFKLEEEYKEVLEDIYLFVFVDEPKNIINRDDGNSISNKLDDIQREKLMFEDAYERSNIKKKMLINIDNISIDQVHNLIVEKINE